ncbi:hypothetical protein CBR_g22949 [Chara braunii]|uniref:Glutamine amidotransferase type-2 domain-containing protein n=1 Tax=Chara braunii TaxID=69332 RepID=A0A388L354_CHABU|nr:hypothetical protein CBR_g22949 [Chara braunii]|eukprot:GBG76731.1 hypothetical protein CBR_g22949 [Chara braunii]
MCRLMAYLGSPCLLADLVTKPSRSLTRQSYDAKERLTGHGYLNGDGFGVGWYTPETHSRGDPTPCVFTSIQPAWNNGNLERLAKKIVSPLIFAHVRAAYPGIPVSDSNCQPFVCGRYMWMHNGTVGGFLNVRRKLLNRLRDDVYDECPSFESDSGISFAIFLNQIENPMVELPPDELAAKLQATINEIQAVCAEGGCAEEESLLNFVVSDGNTVVASRYCNVPGEHGASLYYASGSHFVSVEPDSNNYFVKHEEKRPLLGIVASEPLTDDSADWLRVPRNSMVVMTRMKGEFVDVIVVPINAPPPVAKDVSRCFKALENGGVATVLQGGEGPGMWKSEVLDGVRVVEEARHAFSAHGRAVMAVACDGSRLWAGLQDGAIKVFDMTEFRCVHTLVGHSQTVLALKIHGKQLYSLSTKIVKVWDTLTYELLSTIRYSDGDVFALGLADGQSVRGPAEMPVLRCYRPSCQQAAPTREHDSFSEKFASPASGAAMGGVEKAVNGENGAYSRGNGPSSKGASTPREAEGAGGGVTTTGRGRMGRMQGMSTAAGGERLPTPPCQMRGGVGGCVARNAAAVAPGASSSRGGEGGVDERLLARRGLASDMRVGMDMAGDLEKEVEEYDDASDVEFQSPCGGEANAWMEGETGREEDVPAGPFGGTDHSSSNTNYRRLLLANGSLIPDGGDYFGDGKVANGQTIGYCYEGDVGPGTGTGMKRSGSFPGTPVPGGAIGSTGGGGGGGGGLPVQHEAVPVVSKSTSLTLPLTDGTRMGHCSRVFAMAVCGVHLCSGAGDSFVKVWSLNTGCLVATLYGHRGAVMALAGTMSAPGNWRLLSGSRDNTIRVWNLGTLTCITTITGHTSDILGLEVGYRGEFYSLSADHTIRMWCLDTYECLQVFVEESMNLLSLACTANGIVSGTRDGMILVWDVETSNTPEGKRESEPASPRQFKCPLSKDLTAHQEHRVMQEALRKFVRFRTVSSDKSTTGCDQIWRCANFLAEFLQDLGAEAKLIVPQEGTSPVVLGKLMGDRNNPTLTFCGHYDTTDARKEDWSTDPFDLLAVDGYLYGRGVSDTKGPIITMLFAVRDLISRGELKINANFIFDGTDENGSVGFKKVVQDNQVWFEGTDLILTSSGAWFSDSTPCLIYGTRGRICLRIEVTGPEKDLHTGSDGGAFSEPMNDLLSVLVNLVDTHNMILVPGFYEDVKRLTPEETKFYEALDSKMEDYNLEYKAAKGLKALTARTGRELLMNRSRLPSLSITGIDSFGEGWSRIPKCASARVVIRHVPNQDAHGLIEKLKSHVLHEFAKLRSLGNKIEVHQIHLGDWWLADPQNPYYRTAEKCIERQWGVQPMYVCEGSTIPVVSFLEKTLGAPALHLPICQATGHLADLNERLRWTNFVKGKEVMKDLFAVLGRSPKPFGQHYQA